ncbi:MAG: metallophosphatase family protein [Anaerolineales bacterium]|nr:metallophosphatase family protein [Anaerolineales bacterium]
MLTDSHANLPALTAVLEDIHRRGCERIYHAGDLIAIGPYPAEVVDLAMSSGMRCVLGNHDELVLKGIPLDPTPGMDDDELRHQHWTHSRLDKGRRDFIRGFPYALREEIEGVKLTVVHFALTREGDGFKPVNPRGSDEEILGLFGDTAGDVVCFGHLHERRFNREFFGRHFLNPGAVGCSHQGEAGYAIVDLSGGRFVIEECRVKYDRCALLERYRELEIPAREVILKVFFGVDVLEG